MNIVIYRYSRLTVLDAVETYEVLSNLPKSYHLLDMQHLLNQSATLKTRNFKD
jgi:hypothetical protein